MKMISFVLFLLLISSGFSQYYYCISQAFSGTCKTQLYACTNNPQCSYQLHENTKHIFLYEDTQVFPTLYFSNPLARNLYACLKTECKLPQIDQSYPKTLPLDYCLMQVFDICGGNIEQVYKNPKASTPVALCYQKYCTITQKVQAKQ